jgi:hypothetical protein
MSDDAKKYLDSTGVSKLVELIKNKITTTYATKSDLDNYATKSDLDNYQPLITSVNIETGAISNMEPNRLYIINGQVSSVSVSSVKNIKGAYNEYMLQFTAGTDCTFSWPNTLKWANNLAPIFEANKTYNISILNNLGVWAQF